MKKLVALLLTGALSVTAVASLAACNNGGGDASTIEEKITLGQTLSEAELIAKAKEESGKFYAYGNTSRISDAMPKFIEKYGSDIGLTEGKGTKKKDSEIYALLAAEAISKDKSENASMVLIQDSATLSLYREQANTLANYVPKGMEDKVDEANRVPLAHQFINKLFMYNNTGETNLKFNNVWQLTQPAYKNKIYFKTPKEEQVNMNFLIMLTSDEWSNKLKDAYKALNNGQEATDVGADKKYKNYGYKWIAEFIANCNFSIKSDTTICTDLAKPDNAGNMGLFVLSKLRDAGDNMKNLTISCWEKEGDEYVTVNPFAGFMYSIYAQLVTNGPRPYTAMLFVNYLMSEEGFEPWNTIGGYSSNTSIAPKDEIDQSYTFYNQRLVIENGDYIKGVKTEVEDWVNKLF